MKLWQARRFSELKTKLIFQVPPGAASAPGENVEDPYVTEKNETIRRSQDELGEFITNAEAINSLSTAEQIRLLSILANTEKDSEGDDRGLFAKMRDTAGSGLEYLLPEKATRYLQSALDGTSANNVIPHISAAAKTTFLNNFKSEARKLCTDDRGDGNFRATLYGDPTLESNANLTELFADYPDNKFVIMGNEKYVRTARGYIGFYPAGNKGNVARIESGTTFQMTSSIEDESPEAKALTHLKATDTAFSGIDSPAEIRKLERWRSQNFSLSQTWKSFAKDMESRLGGNPHFESFNQKYQGNFINFLDGNFYKPTVSDGKEGLTFDGIPPLDSSEDPNIFQGKIELALNKITTHIQTSIKGIQDKIESTNNIDEKRKLRAELSSAMESSSSALKEAGLSLADLEQQTAEWMEVSNDNFLRILDGSLDRERLVSYLTAYDEKLLEIIKTEPFDHEAQKIITIEVLAKITGSQEAAKSLADQPEIMGLMRERLDILEKRIRVNDLNYKLQTRTTQLGTVTEASENRSGTILKGYGIDVASFETLSVDKLLQAQQDVQRRLDEIAALPEGENSHDNPEDYEKALVFLNAKIASLGAIAKKSEESAPLMANIDYGMDNATQNMDVWSDPETPEGRVFHDAVDITADYVREYRETHDGATPDIDPEIIKTITKKLDSGETPDAIRASLNLKVSKKTTEPEKNIEINTSFSIQNLPKGATNGKTLENGNLAFNAGDTEIEFDAKTNTMFPLGVEGLQKGWLSFPAKDENLMSVQLGSAIMGASVEDGQEGAGLMVRGLGKEKFQDLMTNLSYPRMGRLLQPNEVEGLQAIKNQYGDIKIVFEKLGLLRPDGQAAPEKAGEKSQEFFDILTSAAVGNFGPLE